jgi:hypothetical protein
MSLRFHAAPWPTGLKLISALGTLIIAGAGYAAYRAIPTPSGFTHYFGLGIAMVFPATLVLSLLFAVSGYAVDGNNLYIQRPLWHTRFPLEGLSRFWLEPTACKGSLRIFGNGGLYSFTGLYWSPKLGRYRLFATDLAIRRACPPEARSRGHTGNAAGICRSSASSLSAGANGSGRVERS